MEKTTLIFVGIIACLVSIASSTPGIASFYSDYSHPACPGLQHEGNMIAAASDVVWDNGAACGKMFTVTCTGPGPRNPVPNPCTGRSVTVKIIDHCPGGCVSTLDLSRDAYALIANPVAGLININYTQVHNDKTEV